MILNWHSEENLVVNNVDDRVLMSLNYQSGSCPLESYTMQATHLNCALMLFIYKWVFFMSERKKRNRYNGAVRIIMNN